MTDNILSHFLMNENVTYARKMFLSIYFSKIIHVRFYYSKKTLKNKTNHQGRTKCGLSKKRIDITVKGLLMFKSIEHTIIKGVKVNCYTVQSITTLYCGLIDI